MTIKNYLLAQVVIKTTANYNSPAGSHDVNPAGRLSYHLGPLRETPMVKNLKWQQMLPDYDVGSYRFVQTTDNAE